MKRYRKLQEYFKHIFTYRDRNISDTEHSIERFNERFPKLKLSTWKRVVSKGIDIIIDTFKDSSGKYLIVNKATKVIVQLEWRKDTKSKDGKNHGFSATTLHYDLHKKELKKDTKLFVEDFKKHNLESWFDNDISYKKMIEDIGYYDVKLQECPDYKTYIKEGKMYRNFKIIEIGI